MIIIHLSSFHTKSRSNNKNQFESLHLNYILCFEHRIQFNFQSNKTPDFTFDFKRKKVYRLKTQVVSQVEPREEGK